MYRIHSSVLVAAVLTAFASISSGSGQPAEQPVRFAIIGDRTGEHVEGVHEQIVREIERLRPEFVMTVGDHIEGYHQDSGQYEQEWDEYRGIVAPLSMPLHYTPGNHDIYNDVALDAYRRRVGKPYYSFDHRGVHVVVLDVSRWEWSSDLPAEQLDWLAADLAASTGAIQTLVFQHKPFWYNTTARGQNDTLHTLFVRYGVDAVFTGHFHEYFSGEYDGIKYTSVGSSGGGTEADTSRLGFHFTWVTVDERGVEAAPIRAGSVLPWNAGTADDVFLSNWLDLRGLMINEPLVAEEGADRVGGSITVRVNNPFEDLQFDDSVRWEMPEGWQVTPQVVPMKVGPGETAEAVFEISGPTIMGVRPVVSAAFPHRSGRVQRVQVPLRIARLGEASGCAAVPVIDGKLDEPMWAEGLAGFRQDDGSPEASDPSLVYVAYDAGNLYVAARCTERAMDSIRAAVAERDGAVYGEDCFGFFVRPNPARDTAYQVYVNPNGVIFDQRLIPGADGYWNGYREWNGRYEVAVGREAEAWTVELQIPLDQWGVQAKAGDRWPMNFRRKQARLGVASQWQTPLEYDPVTYGVILLH